MDGYDKELFSFLLYILQDFPHLKKNLNEDGIIIIDDEYIEDQSNFKHQQFFSNSEMKKQISNAGMQLIDEVIANENEEDAANYDI